MQSVSALIDFLMSLFRDEDAKAAFDQDPQGALAKHGLQGVTGQDIRDARLVMADRGDVRADDRSGWPSSADDDPVREIHHTTEHYEIGGRSPAEAHETFNVVNIDDRDTVIVNDSFNEQTEVDVVAVDADNSFNEDNSQNADVDVVNVEDSFNDNSIDSVDESAPEPFTAESDADLPPPVEDEIPEEEPDLEREPDAEAAVL